MTSINAEITETRKERVDTQCDVCGKLAGEVEPKGWHGFSHYHHEWGDDSDDSWEWFDVCSVACFAVQLRKSIDAVGNYRSAEVSDMNIEFAKKLLDALNTNVGSE